MSYFNQETTEVLTALDTDREKGLSSAQVEASRAKHGANVIAEEKPKNIFRVFIEQFADLLVLILIAASIVSACTGSWDSTIVIIAVIINIIA